MIKLKVIILIVFLIFIPEIFADKNDQIDFNNLKKTAEKNHVVGMTVLGYRNGNIKYVYNYGYSDLKRKIKVGDNTVFYVASVSKTVTGIAVLKLIEQGKIKGIEEDVSIYLGYKLRNPEFPSIPVSIRHLMTHTAGINDGGISGQFADASTSPDPPSLEELLSPSGKFYNKDVWLNVPPGTVFKYCNLDTILAGAVISKVSGKRFDDFVNLEIFTPAGIANGFTINDVKDINNVAVAYRLDDNLEPYISGENYGGEMPEPADISDHEAGKNPTMLGPHGGLRASVQDLAKIMEIFLNGGVYGGERGKIRILEKKSVNLMMKTHWEGLGYYGLHRRQGLYINITDDLIQGVRLYGHSGYAMGLLSAMYFNRKENFGIIFIMNGGLQAEGKSGFFEIEEEVFRESYRILFR